MPLILFNLQIGAYQVRPCWARVDLGAMAIKGCSAFPKAPALLKPYYQIVQCHIQNTRCGGGGELPLCRGAVSIFYSPSRLGKYGYMCKH